ncbi:uncharacterized protein LOC115633834 isoform X2 [Scaptodrosophila lebanonensis]|uniref:Uncharacterized protein LOC115633834 isoform X2 n=1 Tax=Drosophila lebanonensis TaxID=7225 RepID=A0A6J2UI64_DROLE|nr:uncharacterized protein LOC115633834 isoform X2 [Scaptodrosophila lebanonensis]
MANKDVKTAGIVDYNIICRCCLKPDAELYKLDSLMVARDLTRQAEDGGNGEKITLLRCLLFCIRTENIPELPLFICTGCSKSLQIAYHFIQNALRAHEFLCHKLSPDRECSKTQASAKRAVRFNGQQNRCLDGSKEKAPIRGIKCLEQEAFNKKDGTDTTKDKRQTQTQLKDQPRKNVRHECKVCGAVIYNKLELKQHIRLHSDVISHSCRLCPFITLKQRQLSDHYRMKHDLTLTQVARLNAPAPSKKIGPEPPCSSPTRTSTVACSLSATKPAEDSVVKVCTLEDMELLIPTVLRPEDYTTPHIDSEQLCEMEQLSTNMHTEAEIAPMTDSALNATAKSYAENSTSGETSDMQSGRHVSIGTEYLVLPDGSLQQLNGSGVVIEYINASVADTKNNNDVRAPNLTLQNLLGTAADNEAAMDIDELIVEEVQPQIKIKAAIGSSRMSTFLKHKCSQCPKTFATLARLKSHQLTHTNLPKFYCDQCTFYSLRSTELMDHYKTLHNIQPTVAQGLFRNVKATAAPSDVNKTYSCDMCLFETQSRGQLRVHYNKKHLVEPSEIQLRPSWCADNGNVVKCDGVPGKQVKQTQLPIGITYAPTPNPPEQLTLLTATSSNTNEIITTPILEYTTNSDVVTATANSPPQIITDSEFPSTADNSFAIFPESSTAAEPKKALPLVSTQAPIIGDMQEFIDNTDVAAICTIPADGMPVADGEDLVIDNNNISLDFDAENLFEDFEDEDEPDEEVEEEEEEEDESNIDDENDNNGSAINQNLVHTSDDDDVDDFDDEQSKHLQKPYCVYCNKKFTSQYKFENHMFVHRGLAPYRCELCTNIYNRKRALIRHYRAVHKRIPTRDMVQAKGDKVSVDRTNIEKLHIVPPKYPALMCAKCPFECEQDSEMRSHLNAHHGINDGASCHAGDVFIIRKLPYECPRCIRTFAAKHILTRHLQRSHLVDTIIELQSVSNPQTTSSATTRTTSTTTTTLPNAGEQKAAAVEQLNQGQENKEAADKYDQNLNDTTESIITTAADLHTSIGNISVSCYTPLPTPTPNDSYDYEYNFIGHAHATTRASIEHENDNQPSTSSYQRQGLTADKTMTFGMAHQEAQQNNSMHNGLPNTPIYVCKQCNHTCTELSELQQHQAEQHTISDHLSSPRRNYDFKCHICNSTYRTKTLLLYHMKRHANRNYQCDQCPKTFVIKPELTKHRVTHTNEMPFKCNIEIDDGKAVCAKTFRYKHHLKRHQNASHHLKRFACQFPNCGRELVTKSQLNQHMRMHKGIFAYRCPKCGHAFSRRRPLWLHALRAHQLKMTEDDLAEVYRANVGYTNPHDLKVFTRSGELLRRQDFEAAVAQEQLVEVENAVVNIIT